MPKGYYKNTGLPFKPVSVKGKHWNLSEIAKERMSKAKKGNKVWLGRKHTEESKRKMSIVQRGSKKPRKVKVIMSEETKEKLSKALRGMKRSEEFKEKVRTSRLKRLERFGFLNSPETRKKISNSLLREKNWNWKGGISFEPYTVNWNNTLKRAIRERDNYVCRVCNQYGQYVHHIDYDKKNCNPGNLIILCNRCHGKTNQNRDCWTNYFRNLNET